jgi:hypothetical protein
VTILRRKRPEYPVRKRNKIKDDQKGRKRGSKLLRGVLVGGGEK